MTDTNGNGAGQALVQRADAVARQGNALGGDKEALNTAVRIANALASSSIVPEDYRNNVPNVMVALEYANRLGASVLAVMQNLDVIHGRPALRATFLMGTVNASGRFTPIRYQWQGKEGTDSWGCRAVAIERESGEECIGPLITIALAKAEKWFSKSDSKWQTIPELMLMYRAGAWWARVYAPEIALGLHTTDEIEDMAGAAGGNAQSRAQNVAAALDRPDDEIPEAEYETTTPAGQDVTDAGLTAEQRAERDS